MTICPASLFDQNQYECKISNPFYHLLQTLETSLILWDFVTLKCHNPKTSFRPTPISIDIQNICFSKYHLSKAGNNIYLAETVLSW